jgi:hypothetical protein
VRRITGSSTYYWSQIDRIEVFDGGASFGDNEERRAGIALYMRDPQRKVAGDAPKKVGDAPPDVQLISYTGDMAAKIPKLVERLSNAKRAAGGGKDARRLGAKPAQGNKAGKSFRRSSTA